MSAFSREKVLTGQEITKEDNASDGRRLIFDSFEDNAVAVECQS